MDMNMRDGLIRTAAATPKIRVADPDYNGEQIIKLIEEGFEKGAKLMVFPELCLTAYTCGDLFQESHDHGLSSSSICSRGVVRLATPRAAGGAASGRTTAGQAPRRSAAGCGRGQCLLPPLCRRTSRLKWAAILRLSISVSLSYRCLHGDSIEFLRRNCTFFDQA